MIPHQRRSNTGQGVARKEEDVLVRSDDGNPRQCVAVVSLLVLLLGTHSDVLYDTLLSNKSINHSNEAGKEKFWEREQTRLHRSEMAEQVSRDDRTRRTRHDGAVRGGASGRGAGGRQDDDDAPVDVFQWVAKTRVGTETQVSEGKGEDRKQQRAGGQRQGQRAGGRGAQFVQKDEEQPKIKQHAVAAMEGIGGGEEMILTLEDRGVLDEEGGDVLENVREAELKRNAHGRMRAEKAKPLWEEDGVSRGLLDKYDEEEEEATYVLGGARSGVRSGAGGENEMDGRRKAMGGGGDGGGVGLGSVKARLEEAKMSLLGVGGDYYTAEEVAKGKKKKGVGEEAGGKKRKTKEERKQRRLKKKALTPDEIAEMEVAVEGGGGGNGGGDGGDGGKVAPAGSRHVGSRGEREARVAAREAAELAAAETARGRFDSALAQANLKSEGLRADRPGEELGAEEEMLAASMAKARAVALNSKRGSNGLGCSVEDVAKLAIARREKAKELVKVEDGLTFTDVGEFARSIATLDGVKAEDAGGSRDGGDEKYGSMDVDVKEEEIENAVEEKKGRKRYRKHGGGQDDVMAAGDANGRGGRIDAIAASDENPDLAVAPSAADKNKLGPGLGSVLSLLKDRGELNKPVEWGGRANDSRNSFFTKAMGGFSDVYSGGRTDNELAANVEVALTRKDEFGRVMTPKEAFRQFCHNFHGIQPSQNSKEKRLKQAQKDLAQKRRDAGASSGPGSTQHAKRDTPFVSLDGTIIKPGQRRE